MPPEINPNHLLAYLLRKFFYFLYHQFAWSYDFVAGIVSLGLWQDWVPSILPHLSGRDILELGHGPGHLQLTLRENNYNTIGIDESGQMVRLASARLYKAGYDPQVIRGLSQLLPFEDETFHHVVSTFPTEYIYRLETIAETFRVLTPGGSLIILPVAWLTGDHRLEHFMSWVYRITGQAPEWDDRYLEPYSKAGFRTQTLKMEIRSSIVLIIIATKP